MYVVFNVLQVPIDRKEKMHEIFSLSAETMKQVSGCLEFMLLDSTEDDKLIVYTKWEDKDAFLAWSQSEAFRKAHEERRSRGITATASKIEAYEVIYST